MPSILINSNDQSSQFYVVARDLLKGLAPNTEINFADNVWALPFSYDSKLIANLDFSDFLSNDLAFQTVFTIYLTDKEKVILTPIEFAKWLLLNTNADMAVNYRIVYFLDTLKLLFKFLKDNSQARLEINDVCQFVTLLLTHDFKKGKLIRRYHAPAYASRLKLFKIREMQDILLQFKVDCLLDNFPVNEFNKQANEACIVQINMTLTDYQKGGSFNYLGLDVGRHYIDFCGDFFESNIAMATSLANTLKKLGLNITNGKSNISWQDLITTGSSLNSQFINVAYDEYKEVQPIATAFKLEALDNIANELKLETYRLDTHEFLRSMLYARLFDSELKKREFILEEYKSYYYFEAEKSDTANTNFLNISLDQFDQVTDKIIGEETISKDKFCLLLRETIKTLSLKTNLDVNNYLKDVESSGITLLVAYTGYRASEYGFSIDALKSEVNRDIKDAVYTPFRFKLLWFVPKTNGVTKLNREITTSCAVLIRQLNAFTEYEDNGYAISSQSANDSVPITRIVYKAVRRMWLNFPFSYQLFDALDVVENEMKNPIKYNKFKRSCNFNLNRVNELISLKNELRYHAQIRELSMREYRGENGSTIRFEKVLTLYKKGKLPKKDVILLEKKLSKDTLTKLADPRFILNQASVSGIKNELIADTYFATPHSLRHIWAEAVMRRYKGNVGRFIRSNFKHIDPRFFIAYMQDKEMKAIVQVAKRTTINTTVKNCINSLKSDKEQFIGGFNRFIRKAVSITKSVSQQELEELAEDISENRIIYYQSQPWADCILRIGTHAQAKCSSGREASPHKASPSLCLGCINGNIEESNYAGIVAYIKTDIDVCRNEKLPQNFKLNSLRVLQVALKRILELKNISSSTKYDKFITYLKESIKLASI